MRRCFIRYEFSPLGSFLVGRRHHFYAKTLDLRKGKSPFRQRRRNFEETLAYIQLRMFFAFLYYLRNQNLTRIYLYIYFLFNIYLFIIHLPVAFMTAKLGPSLVTYFCGLKTRRFEEQLCTSLVLRMSGSPT